MALLLLLFCIIVVAAAIVIVVFVFVVVVFSQFLLFLFSFCCSPTLFNQDIQGSITSGQGWDARSDQREEGS